MPAFLAALYGCGDVPDEWAKDEVGNQADGRYADGEYDAEYLYQKRINHLSLSSREVQNIPTEYLTREDCRCWRASRKCGKLSALVR